MIIVKDAKTEFSILVAENCSESIMIAANALSGYFEQCVGVGLPIVHTAAKPFISIGCTDEFYALGEEMDEKSLNTDGFKILFRDGNIFLCAAAERGVVYAVNDFAERYMGVRFLSVGETVCPSKEMVEVEEKDVVEVPTFASRSYFAYSVKRSAEFSSKMRFVGLYTNDTIAQRYGGGFLSEWSRFDMHSMQIFLPRDLYYESHPEWYAENKSRAWLCLTNGLTDDDQDDGNSESLLSVISENIIQDMIAHPKQKYFMLGHEDSNFYCQCERCKKSRERNVTPSGYLMVWINAIARRIEAWRKRECPKREVYLVTFSYHETIIPPVYIDDGVEKQKPFEFFEREFWAPLRVREGKIVPVNKNVVPEQNVIIFCAPMATCYMHDMNDKACDWNQYSGFPFKGWEALGAKMMVWYYGVNFWHHLWWFPNRRTMQSHLAFYEQYHPLFVMQQGAPREDGFYQTILNTYLLSKLMWNIHLDVDDLTKEFNDLYFGEEIAVHINCFIEKMENHYEWLNEKYQGLFHSDLAENFEMSLHFENFPYAFLVECIDELNLALSKAENEELKRKVKRVLIQPLYMLVYNLSAYSNADAKYVDILESYMRELDIKYLSENFKTPEAFIKDIRDKQGK